MKTVDLNTINEAVASGNHKAFRVFYDLYYMRIYKFVRYFLPTRQECELILSDIFYIVWEKRYLLSGVKNMDAYLYQISRNEIYRYLKEKKLSTLVSIDGLTSDISALSYSVEDKMMEDEMMKVYQLAINKLPKRCKQIFLMVREQKMSHKEVADHLGITSGTIEVQMNIAIKRISAIVKMHYPKLIKK